MANRHDSDLRTDCRPPLARREPIRAFHVAELTDVRLHRAVAVEGGTATPAAEIYHPLTGQNAKLGCFAGPGPPVTDFLAKAPTLDANWRAVVLHGGRDGALGGTIIHGDDGY